MGRARIARRERDPRPSTGSTHALTPGPRRPAGFASRFFSPGFPVRLALAAALAAALALPLLAPGAAQAQTAVKVVSNTGQTSSSNPGNLRRTDHRQRFTTGSNANGYKLKHVDFELNQSAVGSTDPTFTATLRNSAGTTTLGTFTNPSSLRGEGAKRFTLTTAVDLDSATEYMVMLDVTAEGVGTVLLQTTSVNAEDDGKAAGWSINDGGQFRDFDATNWTNSNNSRQIAVYGWAKAPTVSSAVVDGTALSVTMNGPLDATSVPAASAFDVAVGVGQGTIDSVAVSGSVVTLTLASAVAADDPVAVTYSKPATGNKLKALSGGDEVAAFAISEVTNDTAVSNMPSPSSGALVSNTGQTGTSDAVFTVDRAQRFTTGSNGAGYMLTSVVLRLKSSAATAPVYSVTIQGDSSSAPDGTSLGTLTTSTSLTNSFQLVEFEASGDGISLAANTDYWVVLDVSSGDGDSASTVTSRTVEDPNPAPGWSIADVSYFRNLDNSGSWTTTVGVTPLALELHGSAKTGVTGVTGIAISSTPSAAADTYGLGEQIQVQVTFNEAVAVTGTPRLKIKMDPNFGEFWADYDSGSSSSTALTFAHAVVSPNRSTQGIAVLENSLELNGGTIKAMAAGQADAVLSHAGLAHDPDHKVNHALMPSTVDTPGSTAEVLVSNTGQTAEFSTVTSGRTGQHSIVTWTSAQLFTTGADPATLSEVGVKLGTHDGDYDDASKMQVSIYSTTASGNPDSSLQVLTNPMSFTDDAVNTFRASPELALAANTSYAIVINTTDATKSNQVQTTTSEDEDSAAAAGWNIGNAYHSRRGQTVHGITYPWTTSTTGPLVVEVRGTVQTATDTTAPELQSVTVAGATVTLTFDRPLDETSTPVPGRFDVAGAGSGGAFKGQTPTGVAIVGSTLTLTLATPATAGQTVRVVYVKPTGAPFLRGANGVVVEGFDSDEPTTPTVDGEAPTFLSAAVHGTVLQVTFSEALATAAAARPAPGAFTVMVEGARRNVASVAVAGATVRLRLVSAVGRGERVTVAYDKPARGGVLQNPSGVAAPSFDAQPVRHATPVWPAVYGAQVNGDRVTVTFDHALDVDRRPAAGRFKVEQYFREYRAVAVSRVEIDPSAPNLLVLTLTRSVRTGGNQPIRMHYEQGGDANVLRGVYGQRVGDLSGVAVANLTPVPLWGAPGTEGYLQVNPTDKDSPCGRYRPGLTLEELQLGYRYVCDPAQRQWTLVRYSVVGVDYRSDYEIAWTLVADMSETTGRCLLRGYDDLAGVWRLMSTPDGELCERARTAQAQEGGVVTYSVTVAEPAKTKNTPKTVAYRTEPRTATPGLDYLSARGRLVFGPGEQTKRVQVQTLRDGESEGPETVVLRLFDAQGFPLPEQGLELVGTILDGAADAAPAVTGVAIVSDPGPDATYGPGETIRVQLAFDEAVAVDTAGGTPRLTIDMDPAEWGAKPAAYAGGSGTATLTFTHTVVEPNVSTQGVAVLADTLELGGGTIRSQASGADAALSHGGLDHDPAHRVDWALDPNRAPVVDERSRHFGTFTAPGNAPRGVLVSKPFHGIFSDPDGDELTYTVTLADDGQAGLVDLLRLPTAAELQADFRPIEVTLRVAFRADAAGDWDAIDPALPNPAPIAVTLTATDPGGRSASVRGVFLAHWEPRVPPSVTAVAVTSDAGPDDTYALGDTIRVAVTFDGPVAVDTTGGVPRLTIDMDPADWGAKRAVYEGGNGTATLTFTHTVVEPNFSTQGIAVLADTLEANGGAIRSRASGADAALAHDGLAHDPKHKVDWRPALSVADARASEGADAAVEFAVTLSRAATRTVSVDYATRDGTATAGEDYTAVSGRLTFAAGESAKTVSVPVLDDALDEGEETFTLGLSNAQGARIVDGEATGTIENSDPLQKMWLSRFGRTVADHVTAAVSDRLAKPLAGARVTVGGQSLDLAEVKDDAWLGRTLTAVARVMGAPSGPAAGVDSGSWPGAGPGSGPGQAGAGPWPGTGLGLRDTPPPGSAPAREITGRELLLGSAFHLAREGDGGGPGLAAWGRVTVGGFDGEAPADGGKVRIDGDVTTGILGTDAEWNRLLAGVAVSVSAGEGTFDQPGVDSGTIESMMTTVSPYARVNVSERVSVWGLAGYGTGDMTIVQAANDATGQPERITQTDLSMRLAALGGRGALLTADANGGFDLALKADGFFVQTTSEAISNEGDTSADASRVRLALEGSRAFRMDGGVLTPGLELGLRHDGGDAETGTGVELGGRVSYADSDTGLSVEANVRALVAHEDSQYREWGASGAVRLAPGERGRGLSFSLAPTWGAPGSGVDRLWAAQDARGLAPTGGRFEPESRLEGELGYGLPLLGDRFTGTPNVGLGLTGSGARDYRIGWRLTSAVRGDPGFEVTLDATRREAANDNDAAPAEHGVMLRGAIRW